MTGHTSYSYYMATVGRLFDFLDEDGSKEISWSEFLAFQVKARKALEATWPMDLKSLRREFSALDSDGNGSITKEEFLQVFGAMHGTSTGNGLAAMDALMDEIESKSHSRKGTKKRHGSMVNRQKEEFIRRMMEDFDKADLNGDGKIDFSEYVRKVWDDTTLKDDDDDEFASTTTPITLRQLRREFRKQDLNGDGKISRREFQHLAEKMFSEKQQQHK